MVPAWFLGLIVASVIAMVVYGDFGKELPAVTGTSSDIVRQGLQLLFTFLVIYLFRKYLDRRSVSSLGFKWANPFRRDLLVGMALGIGLIGLVFGILLATDSIVITDMHPPGSAFAVAVVVMIMVGIGEELVMRGYIQGNMMTSMNKYAALLATSALFGISHLLNPNASLVGIANIVLAGLLLGIYYTHRRNLWLPIGMHFTWNLFQGSVFGSPVGGVTAVSVINYDAVGSDLLTGGLFGFEGSLVTTCVTAAAALAVHLIYRPRTA